MSGKVIDLSKLSEEELLKVKIRDLGLSIEGTWLEDCIQQLYGELDSQGIKFKPPCYLADEWLAPDEEPIIGIPFFLAHPTLIKLERKMMLDVEGGTKAWCMKLLRHETGHALNYAYKLYRRKNWQKIFGKFSKEYADTYRFRPYSKNFVRHLENHYAQYHPDEDFSETFAVWLTPGLNWQQQYKGWRVISKLHYVDKIINEVKDKEPLVEKGSRYWEARRMRTTLKSFYKKKRRSYAEDFPDFHDSNLRRIFTLPEPESKPLSSAAAILKKYRKEILNNVARWTGERKYIIGDLIDTLIQRSRELKLVVVDQESLAVLKISTYITTLVMNYLYTGGFSKER
ncbi:MAG: hypothetical protein K9L86_08375 [Candidatus Omnitrophica bacterium]|nr:hypothetical protein [Candidatus Omnitrophota bacterium]